MARKSGDRSILATSEVEVFERGSAKQNPVNDISPFNRGLHDVINSYSQVVLQSTACETALSTDNSLQHLEAVTKMETYLGDVYTVAISVIELNGKDSREERDNE